MITETEIQITDRLGITSETYAELMYDTGCRWLDKLQDEVTLQFPGREHRIAEMFAGILRNQLFWRWWTLEWQATDRAYLNNRDQSRRRYFMRQTETPRNMPQNVSRQLLHYAVRYKLSAQETRQAASAAEGVKKTA